MINNYLTLIFTIWAVINGDEPKVVYPSALKLNSNNILALSSIISNQSPSYSQGSNQKMKGLNLMWSCVNLDKPVAQLDELESIKSWDDLSLDECPRDYRSCGQMDTSVYTNCSVDPRLSCSCAPDCAIYGKCCLDWKQSLNESEREKLDGSGDSPWGGFNCLPYVYENTMSFLEARSKCSKSWGHEPGHQPHEQEAALIRNSCESPAKGSYFEHVLVTHQPSSITYRNVYCASCNYRSNMSELLVWDYEARCWNISENLKTILRRTSTGCTSYSAYSYDLRVGISFCFPQMISKCSREWIIEGDTERTEKVRKSCFTYFAPVLVAKRAGRGRIRSTYFKNKFCARCNGIHIRDLYCSSSHLPKVHWSKVGGYRFTLDPFSGSGGGRCHSDLEIFDQYAGECRRVFLNISRPKEVEGHLNLSSSAPPSNIIPLSLFITSNFIPLLLITLMYFSTI